MAEVIDEIFASCPQMFMEKNEQIVKNIEVVISYGFPEYEIGELLLLNPSFVFNNTQDLQSKLSQISGDVYRSLMLNPSQI